MFAIKISRVTILICLLFSQIVAAETEMSPAFFSHTAAITFNDPKAVAVTVRLPQWSYFASKHQLGDLRIFNTEGIAVAYQLAPVQQNVPSSEFSVDAIAIPVEADVKEVAGHSADIQLDLKGKVAIHLSEQANNSKSGPITKVTQLILDDPKLNSTAINNFRFELDETQKTDFEAELAVESSEDLRAWRTIASNQKLMAYYGSHRIAQLSIAIPSIQARYWRIRSNGADLGRISKIYVTMPPQATIVNESLTVDCQLSTEKERILCPLNGSRLPIRSMQFDFGGQRIAFSGLINTYTQAPPLEISIPKQQPTQTIITVLTSSKSTAIGLNGQPIAVIELFMEQGGRLGLTIAPKVTVQWPAQQLTFLAHGSAPFLLAVGADQLVKRSEQPINSEWPTATGVIAESVKQEPQAFPALLKKRPWLLWGLLVAAVLTLGWMAISLLKER